MIHLYYDTEGSDVGYRWFSRQQYTPLFPFGHGLSYTRFHWQDPQVSVSQGALMASCTVTNSGKRRGAEVVMLFIAPRDGHYVPRLVAFQRVEVEAGESQRITLTPESRIIAGWDEKRHGWLTKGGEYQLLWCKDASNVILQADISLEESFSCY